MRFKLLFTLLVTLLFALTLSLFVFAASNEENEPITTRSGLESAIKYAKDGDTIFVSDINFNISATGAVNEIERLSINKSITIKSAKNGEKATFLGGSFVLEGTLLAGESSDVKFIDIIFDGEVDGTALTDKDWELPYDSMGELISNHPLKAQYAIMCRGFLSASFENCEFKNYMYEYGPAIRAFYGDYSYIPEYQTLYGNNLHCKLNLSLNNCKIESNSSLYGGGAIYLDGYQENISLNSKNTVFSGNKSGFVEFPSGGGALYIAESKASFENCTLTDNIANYYYGGVKTDSDQIQGGAIACERHSTLIMRNCIIANNKASLGGGISIIGAQAEFYGCIFTKNQATPSADNHKSEMGISSSMGLGGALYINGLDGDVQIVNTDIYSNTAQNVCGGIFASYYDMIEYNYSVNVKFSSIANNVCLTKMQEYKYYGNSLWKWHNYPGDIFDISYMNFYGSILIDELLENEYPRYETPNEANNYNYIACPAKAKEDGYIIILENDLYEHKGLKNAATVPFEFAKEHLGAENTVLMGEFTVGSNVNDAIFNLYVNKKLAEKYINPFGTVLALPQYEKKGYIFEEWKYKNTDDTVLMNNYYIVGNRSDTVSVYTDRSLDINPVIVIITIVSVITVIAILIFILIYTRINKKKKVVEAVQISENNQKYELNNLTPRENEVLSLLLEGKTRKEIGKLLFVSENTVKKQITSIYQKLDVKTRNELFARFNKN